MTESACNTQGKVKLYNEKFPNGFIEVNSIIIDKFQSIRIAELFNVINEDELLRKQICYRIKDDESNIYIFVGVYTKHSRDLKFQVDKSITELNIYWNDAFCMSACNEDDSNENVSEEMGKEMNEEDDKKEKEENGNSITKLEKETENNTTEQIGGKKREINETEVEESKTKKKNKNPNKRTNKKNGRGKECTVEGAKHRVDEWEMLKKEKEKEKKNKNYIIGKASKIAANMMKASSKTLESHFELIKLGKEYGYDFELYRDYPISDLIKFVASNKKEKNIKINN